MSDETLLPPETPVARGYRRLVALQRPQYGLSLTADSRSVSAVAAVPPASEKLPSAALPSSAAAATARTVSAAAPNGA